jgi:hypothetical protein
MNRQPRKPVSRWKVLAGFVVLVGAVAGIVAVTEALRYPHPTGSAVTAPGGRPEPVSDPRIPVACDAPLPREGLSRVGGETEPEPATVTSSQLYDCPQQYDGTRVRYRGEVVGAVLRRSGGAWVHLNDDVYADTIGPLPSHRDFRGGNAGVGVFVSAEMANSISAVGGPTMRGDVLEVVGTFHRVDTSGEVAIIRAAGATRTPGKPLERPSLPVRRVVAIVLAVLTALVVIVERRATRDR